jgi:plastocyanin
MFVTACGSSSSDPVAPSPSPTPVASGSSSTVSIPPGAETLGSRAFMPDQLEVVAGTTVTWTNTDSVAHTSTSDVSGWNSGTIAPRGQFSTVFQTAGTFSYHCSIHPGMVGTVVVR